MALQVAVGRDGLITEQILVSRGMGGEPLPVVETVGTNGGRVHLVQAPAGPVLFTYSASTAPPTSAAPPPDPYDDQVLSALRQSRYCPSDLMAHFAEAELRTVADPNDLALAAASWVFERIAYVPGSTGPSDTAVDTLLSARGVCRDFAHLTIALCRARGVPARLVAVYAPGLTPMDFHAVVEVWRSGRWEILDPTRLAPRGSLVRVATGRDAADTALTATISGDVELVTSEVLAVADGDLPADDHVSPVVLP